MLPCQIQRRHAFPAFLAQSTYVLAVLHSSGASWQLPKMYLTEIKVGQCLIVLPTLFKHHCPVKEHFAVLECLIRRHLFLHHRRAFEL